MSEINNVGETWIALNTLKCNHLTPLHFKGLEISLQSVLVFYLCLTIVHHSFHFGESVSAYVYTV